MNYRNFFILFILSVALSACDWFYKEVPFNGRMDKSEMVVTSSLLAGKNPIVYVNESNFFLDPTAYEWDSSQVIVDGDYATTIQEKRVRKGYLQDATVQMTINGGSAMVLHGGWVVDTVVNSSNSVAIRTVYAYTADHILAPGDTVLLTVSAPEYKEMARVQQIVPKAPNATIISFDPNALDGPEDDLNDVRLTKVAVRIPAYQGSATDFITFKATCYAHRYELIRQTNILTSEEPTDSVYVHQISPISFIYSNNPIFAASTGTNKSLSQGYYGASGHGLFCQPNTKDEEIVFVVPYVSDVYDYTGVLTESHKESLVIEVMALTQDEYLRVSSMFAADYYYNYLTDYWKVDDGGLNLVETITEIFDEMGSLEGVQLYGNVENAIGHVTASTTQRFVLK